MGLGRRADPAPPRAARRGTSLMASPSPSTKPTRSDVPNRTGPPVWDPCLAPIEHFPLPGPKRVRVVEVLATGTNGGAQEHVFGLMSRLDTTHYEGSVVALSAGSAVRKMQRHG